MSDKLISGTELAEILGLSKSRITRLRQSHVLEADKRGHYDLGAAVRAYVAFVKRGASAAGTVAAHRAAYLDEQRRRLKLSNDAAEGNTVSRETAGEVVRALTARMVLFIESLPARCAPALAGMERDPAAIRDYLTREVRKLRGELSRAFEEVAARMADDEHAWQRIEGPRDERC